MSIDAQEVLYEAREADRAIPDKLADSQISFSKKSNNVVGQD